MIIPHCPAEIPSGATLYTDNQGKIKAKCGFDHFQTSRGTAINGVAQATVLAVTRRAEQELHSNTFFSVAS
jgi:hypothetical protein